MTQNLGPVLVRVWTAPVKPNAGTLLHDSLYNNKILLIFILCIPWFRILRIVGQNIIREVIFRGVNLRPQVSSSNNVKGTTVTLGQVSVSRCMCYDNFYLWRSLGKNEWFASFRKAKTSKLQSKRDWLVQRGVSSMEQLALMYTGGTVRAKKLSLKSLALSGLFGAKWCLPKKIFS